MSLRATIEVIAKLARQGTIKQYAIAGAVAAIYYIQPTLTEDLDILVSPGDFDERKSGLILLQPIEAALAKMGYTKRSDVGIWIEDWPVQFLPVASPLDEEALAQAREVEIPIEGELPIKARILSAEYVVAIALKVGRLKDLARVEAFLDQEAVDLGSLKVVLDRFGLASAWKTFCSAARRTDPLGLC
jgi:hypothetical protein